MSGGSACLIYDGEAMAKKGVILVNINYRVGVFGFLAHPELSYKNRIVASYPKATLFPDQEGAVLLIVRVAKMFIK